MRNTLLKSVAIAAGLLAMVGCGKEAQTPVAEDGDITLTVSLPKIGTRAFGDGTTATRLTYAVYAKGDKTVLIDGNAKFAGLKTTVTVSLAKGKEYDILFWADKEGSVYTFDKSAQTVTANYAGAATSDEGLDAFYAKYTTEKVSGPLSETIVLKRPFAQLNIGTDDLEASKKAGFEVEKTGVKVKVAKTLSLVDGTVSGDAEVEFAAASLPAGETFPVEGYDYLSMDYLLVSAEKGMADVTLTATGKYGSTQQYSYTNVPVQRNYRTNIFGSLLTDKASFNVEINPAFAEPDYKKEVIAEGLVYNVQTKNYEVSSANGLQSMVKAGISGTAVLTDNIDVVDEDVVVKKDVELTLDLNGKTLFNSKDIYDSKKERYSLLLVDGGTLTVKGNGKIDAKENDCYAVEVDHGGEVTIEDGEFVGNIDAVYVTEGLAKIKGGRFDLKQLYDGYKYLLNCLDRPYKEGKSNIIVTGGTFVGFNPADNPEGKGTSYLLEGYTCSESTKDGKPEYTVAKSN